MATSLDGKVAAPPLLQQLVLLLSPTLPCPIPGHLRTEPGPCHPALGPHCTRPLT